MSSPASEIGRRRHEPTGVHAAQHGAGHHPHGRKELAWLSLGALGVVYGDIGTSPLYAIKECFIKENPHRAAVESSLVQFGNGAPTFQRVIEVDNILGVLSLMVWALVLVVCIK